LSGRTPGGTARKLDGGSGDNEGYDFLTSAVAALMVGRGTAENKRRFYALRTLPTLFGDWALQREWGRIGACGRLRHDFYRDEGEALNALAKLAQTKVRRGYRSAD
jgi:predicted DNA-binding WGR domain protein